jgi:hypothetical protein
MQLKDQTHHHHPITIHHHDTFNASWFMMYHFQLLVHGFLIGGRHINSLARRHSLLRRPFKSTMNGEATHSSENRQKPLVIVLAGPTASGKSAVAALLSSPTWAQCILMGHATNNRLPSADTEAMDDASQASNTARGHVISADSVQVYSGVQIGMYTTCRNESEE